MSRSGRMLFAGTSSGTLRAMKFPLTVPGEWQEHQVRMSYDDQYLFTVSEDACLFIFKAVDKEGRGMKRDKEVGYAEEILITKSDLEEKVSGYEKSIKSKNLAFRIQGRRLQSISIELCKRI